jgi:hypothetical protein
MINIIRTGGSAAGAADKDILGPGTQGRLCWGIMMFCILVAYWRCYATALY